MDLKNALAVCLIALFSSTLVLMIARWLDVQAAARIEPQLAAIAEELQAQRQDERLVVYYFHGNKRCPTCEAIESQAHALLETDFADELEQKEIVWKVLNYEQPSGSKLGKRFDVQMAVVVLAKMKGSRIVAWKRLDEVWGLWNDKPAFANFLREKITGMLAKADEPAKPAPPATSPTVEETPANLPLPTIDN